jgi:hypothetical protein
MMRRRAAMMMARRRHRPAAAHQMAAIPDAFAHYTGMRLGTDGRECSGECRKQDERYEFTHGSILEQSWTYVTIRPRMNLTSRVRR